MMKTAHSHSSGNASTVRKSPGAVRRCGRLVRLPRHLSGGGKDDTSSDGWVGVDKRRHAILVLDDGTRLQIHERK